MKFVEPDFEGEMHSDKINPTLLTEPAIVPDCSVISWRKSILLFGISNLHLDQIEFYLEEKQFLLGETILHAGAIDDSFVLIESGKIAIQKDGIELVTKKQGQYVGAVTLTPRSTDAVALSPVRLRILKRKALKQSVPNEIFYKVLMNHINEREIALSNQNNRMAHEIKMKIAAVEHKVKAGSFLVILIGWLISYQFFLGLFYEFNIFQQKSYVDILNPVMMVLVGIASFAYARKSDLPLSSYGLNLNNWQHNLKEALIWTCCFIFGLVLFKLLLINYVPFFQGREVFSSQIISRYPWQMLVFIYMMYSFLVPFQELTARGVIQGNLEKMLPTKRKILWAIILSNLIFSAFHIHYDVKFAVMVFLPGLFWGVMYARQQSLLGVIISHIIIGLFTLCFLGLT